MSNTDNFDSPDGLEPDLDTNVDFEDFEDNKDKSLGESWKKSPLFKFALVGGVIIIVIALIFIFGESAKTPESYVAKGSDVKEAPGVNEVSPVMKQALEEKNDQRVDEAQKQGTSAIPTPITPPKTLLEIPEEDTQVDDPLLRWQQMQIERAKAQREQQLMQERQGQPDPEKQRQVQSMLDAMVAQMEKILGDMKPSEIKSMKVFDMSTLNTRVGADGQVSSSGIDQDIAMNASTLAPVKPATVIVPAGKIEYAQMILEANSDVPGPVVAMIASGQFSGGKLLGKFQSQEEYLVITFDTLVTKKGTSIPVSAYAVDPNTSLTGVATDVDHRYFKRIILPAAAKFVEGLGDAYAETTTTTTQGVASTTTATTDLNTKQELGKAVAEAASSVSDILVEDGKETKPLVTVAAGTPLGILFMSQITDRQILQARSGISSFQGQGAQNPNQFNQNQGQFQGGVPSQGYLNPLQQLQYGLQNQQFLQQNPAPAGTIGQQ